MRQEAESIPLDQLLERAWESRVRGRPGELVAVYPSGTMAVSVTGTSCALNCSHCGGHYLEHMVPVDNLCEELVRRRPSSILLSGGCDRSGSVPLASCLESIRQGHLPGREQRSGQPAQDAQGSGQAGLRINVHPGIADAATAAIIGELATVVSFDFVADDLAIRQAFNGMWTREDYIRTLRELRKGEAEVVPHILAGIRMGKIHGEYEALEFLLGEGVKRLIFIVLIPTKGTKWENLTPPPPEDVARLLAWARVCAPELEISLGCMRPRGAYRRELDSMAILAGVDRMVLPDSCAISLAQERNLKVLRKEECCAFA